MVSYMTYMSILLVPNNFLKAKLLTPEWTYTDILGIGILGSFPFSSLSL